MTNHSTDELDVILKGFVASFINNESFLPPTQARVLEAKTALQAYINQEVVKGRINELKYLVSEHGYAELDEDGWLEVMHSDIRDRISALQTNQPDEGKK